MNLHLHPHRQPMPGKPPENANRSGEHGLDLAAQTRAPGCRVMVVDDEQYAREAMALLLRQQGYCVDVACSGPEAIELARSFDPDVVLLDIAMAGMDGFETALRMRAAAPADGRMRLVAVSGYGGEGFSAACHRAGFDHCLTKPVARSTLIGLLETLR